LDGFSDNKKFYEHKMNAERKTVIDQNSWLYKIATNEKFVKIARSYFGSQGCSLFYADYWHTVPTDSDRIASQVWHRDSEDSRLLKVFIYLNDIKEDNGCFEFLKKTSKGLKYGDLEPHFKVSQSVRATKDTNKFISENEQLVFKGIANKFDVIFCDTTGFHRGGFVKIGNRKLVNLIYVSNNCPHIYYLLKNKTNKMEKFTF
jgi:ectoine hydroxylase-related dioxygenase (phytanoyl-CoA dioxygenase family)